MINYKSFKEKIHHAVYNLRNAFLDLYAVPGMSSAATGCLQE